MNQNTSEIYIYIQYNVYIYIYCYEGTIISFYTWLEIFTHQ